MNHYCFMLAQTNDVDYLPCAILDRTDYEYYVYCGPEDYRQYDHQDQGTTDRSGNCTTDQFGNSALQIGTEFVLQVCAETGYYRSIRNSALQIGAEFVLQVCAEI